MTYFIHFIVSSNRASFLTVMFFPLAGLKNRSYSMPLRILLFPVLIVAGRLPTVRFDQALIVLLFDLTLVKLNHSISLSPILSVNKFDLPINEFAHTPFVQGIFDIFYLFDIDFQTPRQID